MAQEMILVLDFGGQYNQLIARRVRELSVYSEVRPHTMSLDEIKALNPKGIILTGGPSNVYDDDSYTAHIHNTYDKVYIVIAVYDNDIEYTSSNVEIGIEIISAEA